MWVCNDEGEFINLQHVVKISPYMMNNSQTSWSIRLYFLDGDYEFLQNDFTSQNEARVFIEGILKDEVL